MKVSIVIPCYNEGEALRIVYKELREVLTENLQNVIKEYEIIFVDDGSVDSTLSTILTLVGEDNNIKYISFSKNFGKEAAMKAGLDYSSGDCIIIIDADLQHPPELIPQMIHEYNNGFDQVIAKRSRTGEKILRKGMSKLFYKITNYFMDVKLEDGVGDYRLLSKRAVLSLLKLSEKNRFSKGLFSWIGYKSKIIEYQNIERNHGESKWSFSSLLNYAIDGIISFNAKPLRLIIYLGITITMLSIFYLLFNFINILMYGVDFPGYFTLITAILMLGGVQLISIGIIGEYVGRIFLEVKNRPIYIIDKTNVNEKGDFIDYAE